MRRSAFGLLGVGDFPCQGFPKTCRRWCKDRISTIEASICVDFVLGCFDLVLGIEPRGSVSVSRSLHQRDERLTMRVLVAHRNAPAIVRAFLLEHLLSIAGTMTQEQANTFFYVSKREDIEF